MNRGLEARLRGGASAFHLHRFGHVQSRDPPLGARRRQECRPRACVDGARSRGAQPPAGRFLAPALAAISRTFQVGPHHRRSAPGHDETARPELRRTSSLRDEKRLAAEIERQDDARALPELVQKSRSRCDSDHHQRGLAQRARSRSPERSPPALSTQSDSWVIFGQLGKSPLMIAALSIASRSAT